MTITKENSEKPVKSKTKFDNLSSALKENLQRRKKSQKATSIKKIEVKNEIPTP
ncbi:MULTISPECIES: hypothetical protein [unclassified Rickettsia]|uniref:hypothetical protein n=1 Tax=unclassified Rickettsia TaxID=114295 RepID=UPI00209DF893|nr:hypothetical protein [Rickettsia endosymbiont of Ceutorhynchus assimilis]